MQELDDYKDLKTIEKLLNDNGWMMPQLQTKIDTKKASLRSIITTALTAQKTSFATKLAAISADAVNADKDYEQFLNNDRQRYREVYAKRLQEISQTLSEVNE